MCVNGNHWRSNITRVRQWRRQRARAKPTIVEKTSQKNWYHLTHSRVFRNNRFFALIRDMAQPRRLPRVNRSVIIIRLVKRLSYEIFSF